MIVLKIVSQMIVQITHV